MKIARVLFIAVLLCSGFSSTARASSDRSVGFIQLLSHVNPNVPIQVQTEDALRPVMPTLLAAQRSGQILEFETSPSTGVLKMVYRPSAGVLKIAGKTVSGQMKDAMASVRLPKPLSAQHAQAGITATAFFSLTLFDNSFYGSGLPAGAHVVGSLRNASGVVLAVFDGNADGSGTLNSYFPWVGAYSDVAPGYKVTFKVYNGTTLLNTYAAIAPSIRFTSADKVNAIVKGLGPAGKQIFGYWYHRLWNAGNTSLSNTVSTVASGAGIWSLDFGVTPLRGGDFISVFNPTTAAIGFDRDMTLSHAYCVLGGNYCELSGFALTPAALQIIHGGVTRNFTGKFDKQGYFRAYLENADGSPIFLVAGDKISGTGVLQYPLPVLTAAVNYSTNVVTGKAPASKYFNVWVWRPLPYSWYLVYSHSNSLGNFASNFTTQIDLISGNPYMVEIYYVLPTTGNTTDYFKTFGP